MNELIAMTIQARARDIGGAEVRRVIPYMKRRMIGPFIFMDHMGPDELAPGTGMDVAPHPHIGLSTVTYLFEGVITHRDSTGANQDIRPGDVNWMTAGRGVVHSERTPPETRATGQRVHGMQIWVALPVDEERREPEFFHHPAADLPIIERGGARLTLIVGEAYGRRSPAKTYSPLFYLDCNIPPGASFEFDASESGRAMECATYTAYGTARVAGEVFPEGRMAVMRDGARFQVANESDAPARLMIIGGDNIGPRTIHWNFVASDKELLERAKTNWKNQDKAAFPSVPGDDKEFVPLPDFGP